MLYKVRTTISNYGRMTLVIKEDDIGRILFNGTFKKYEIYLKEGLQLYTTDVNEGGFSQPYRKVKRTIDIDSLDDIEAIKWVILRKDY